MKCSHEACTCQVAVTQEFCSDHCREHGETAAVGASCGCGHPECAGSHAST